jgi:hypothetical protein
MMTLKNTKKIEATDSVTKYGCEFCKREFLRESTVLKHICEYKHRWLEKDRQGNRIGFQAWLQFYLKNSTSKKNRTYEEFIKSAYYTAFVKFGSYCVDINALNVNRFVDWLLKNQVKVDAWNSDNSYNKFLTEYLREEDPLDAIARSIETTITLAESERVLNRDILRYANKNKICYAITTGKISPWMLYQSDSGTKFLDGLDETQVKMIIDYINPELWAIKFIRDMKIVPQVKELLVAVGY